LSPNRGMRFRWRRCWASACQYVIAEGEKEGLEAIAVLKRESMGRGSFIPKGIRGGKTEEGTVHPEGAPLPLMRYVKVKEGFEPIARFLLGDVGVVKGWEDALPWMSRENGFGTLVTLEGDVIERSGVMSGGAGTRAQHPGAAERDSGTGDKDPGRGRSVPLSL